jgi:hypothetical protein
MPGLKGIVKAVLPEGVVRELRDWRELPPAAKAEKRRDRSGVLNSDPGPQRCIDAGLHWLALAQDRSATADGGVARHYSLVSGWGRSYPETTGYIVPTLLTEQARAHLPDSQARARRMLDWLVSIQMPDGGFQGGMIGATPRVSVTFNTGQILIGLAAGCRHFGDVYLQPLHRAATFLRDSQDADGCWRRHATPFAAPGDKVYETHVAWGMFEADRVAPGCGYGDSGHRQVAWAIGKQQTNGWLADCCLTDPARPLTHTLGYALRGFVEAQRHRPSDAVLGAALKLAEALATRGLRQDGFLPGRFAADWQPQASWSCLTGAVQIAASWLDLYEWTGKQTLLDAAKRANAFVRRTISMDPTQQHSYGGVKGSYPVDGDYGRFEYLNWAAKFAIDANVRELEVGAAGPRKNPLER